MDISIIILNYKSEQHLSNCIKSLQKYLSDISHEIILVNNDSAPITNVLPDENLQIVNNLSNEGFAKACNRGSQLAQGKILFFLNPDTEIISGEIADLVAAFDDLSVGIVSPQLMTTDGNMQPWSAGCEINIFEVVLNNIGIIRSKKFWKNKKTIVDPAWTSGAALAIRNTIFKKINGFDENFFMYFEDVDLCKKVRSEGLQIKILPTMQVLHLGGGSSSGNVQQKKYYYASQDYYFKKYFSFFSVLALKIMRELFLFFKK